MFKLKKEQSYLINILLKNKKNIIIICIFLIISTIINLLLPLISKNIMDYGFIEKNFNLLIKLIFFMLLLEILGQIIELIKEKLRINMQLNLQKELYEKIFIHLMKLDSRYFKTSNGAQIINNIETDIDNISNIFDEATIFVITQFFSVIGGLIGLYLISPSLTIVVMFFIPIKYIIVKHFTEIREMLQTDYLNNKESYTKCFFSIISGIKEIRIFDIASIKKFEFNQIQDDVLKSKKYLDMIFIKNIISETSLTKCLLAVVYIIGAAKVFGGFISVGGIFAFISYSIYVTEPISAILNIKFYISGIVPSTKRYLEFLNIEIEEDAGEKKANNGDITFKNVSFSYKNKDERSNLKILESANIKINNGDKIAIIGENGSGKSTLLGLLLRFNTPDKGIITINSENIKNYSLRSYRNLFSVVSQDIYLFNDTIKHNITLYKNVKDEDIWNILKKVNLDNFVKKKSLDFMVGENGALLSGGQKQKLALARALIMNRPIVIFDEATSSSDNKSKKEFKSILKDELREKTVIIITHNLYELSEIFKVYELRNKKLTLKNINKSS